MNLFEWLALKFVQYKDHEQGKVPFGVSRSGHWPAVREEYLKEHPECAVCGGTKKLEVHHIEAFHTSPEKELDPKNLISLCEGNPTVNCHCHFGHLGDFRSINCNVRKDVFIWNDKIRNRPT